MDIVSTVLPVIVVGVALYAWQGDRVVARLEANVGPLGGPDVTGAKAAALRALAAALWPAILLGEVLGRAAADLDPEPEDDPPTLGTPPRGQPAYTPPRDHPLWDEWGGPPT